MGARIYQLDDMRSSSSSPTDMGVSSLMPLVSDGSELLLSATSFWAEYATAIASFHWMIVLTGFSPVLKKTRA